MVTQSVIALSFSAAFPFFSSSVIFGLVCGFGLSLAVLFAFGRLHFFTAGRLRRRNIS